MEPSSTHTVRSYDDELTRLNNIILQMGGLVESQIAAAIDAMIQRDSAAAEKVMDQDRLIDDLEHEVERLVTRLLALRQPMATDLRLAIGALKLASDLERMGDLARNIAKRTVALSQMREAPSLWVIPRMAELVQAMVKGALDAYVERDEAKAESVWRRDTEVDEVYNSLFRQLLTYMFEDPRSITSCAHLMFVAKNLERIADHATNMAETIVFLVSGRRVVAERPKADTTATITNNGIGGRG